MFVAIPPSAAAQTAPAPFLYTFGSNGTLKEASSPTTSSSPYFWLNSGAELRISGGIGSTIQGTLPLKSPFQILYAIANPLDTENGTKPQNLFRLLTKAAWGNADTSTKFRIVRTNLTDTPNRGAFSGVLLMARYRDGNNLYYAGMRQDGRAVIKKKINGTYYTLAERAVFQNGAPYHRDNNPNLIPEGKWMSLKFSVVNEGTNAVKLDLLLDEHNTGVWKSVASATDKGTGGAAHRASASSGLRSDYFDLEMDTFRITPR